MKTTLNQSISVINVAASDIDQLKASEPNEVDRELLELNCASIQEQQPPLSASSELISPTQTTQEFQETQEEGQRFLIFTLADRHFAIPAEYVLEVGRLLRITPVPNVPEWLLGITNIRGDMVSVIQLRELLHLQHDNEIEQRALNLTSVTSSFHSSRMLVVRGPDLTTSFVVDSIRGFRCFPLPVFERSEVGDTQISPFCLGVIEYQKTAVFVINLQQLLQSLLL